MYDGNPTPAASEQNCYMVNGGIWNQVFAVPASLVDEQLRLCGAAQLKALLVLLRHAGHPISVAQIAQTLGLPLGDTRDALNYWVDRGFLVSGGGELPRQEAAASQPVLEQPAIGSGTHRDFQPEASEQAQEKPAAARPLPNRAPRQRLEPTEIQRLAAAKPDLKALLDEAEASLGKMLTSADISTLASLYDWAGIPAELLLTVIEYCKLMDKTNLHYIEKVALSWQEQGIDTMEKAEHYMCQTLELDGHVRLVKTAFGIHDRAFTSKERDWVKQWFQDYGFTIALVKLAYERCAERTGKASFPYIAKILTSWHQKNISTPEQVLREEEAFKRQRTAPKPTQSSYDIDEMERLLLHGTPKL